MGTPADKLAYLKATKEAIKAAIKGKGQTVADSATFRSYADKIAAIETGSKPTITVSSSGLITATSGNFSSTKQLTTQGTKTWTPGASAQGINAGTYVTGYQTILGDSDLVASNIKNGVQIFGVTGTCKSTVLASTFSGDFVIPQTSDGEVKITFNRPVSELINFYIYGAKKGTTDPASNYLFGFRKTGGFDSNFMWTSQNSMYACPFDDDPTDPYSIISVSGWGVNVRNSFNWSQQVFGIYYYLG